MDKKSVLETDEICKLVIEVPSRPGAADGVLDYGPLNGDWNGYSLRDVISTVVYQELWDQGLLGASAVEGDVKVSILPVDGDIEAVVAAEQAVINASCDYAGIYSSEQSIDGAKWTGSAAERAARYVRDTTKALIAAVRAEDEKLYSIRALGAFAAAETDKMARDSKPVEGGVGDHQADEMITAFSPLFDAADKVKAGMEKPEYACFTSFDHDETITEKLCDYAVDGYELIQTIAFPAPASDYLNTAIFVLRLRKPEPATVQPAETLSQTVVNLDRLVCKQAQEIKELTERAQRAEKALGLLGLSASIPIGPGHVYGYAHDKWRRFEYDMSSTNYTNITDAILGENPLTEGATDADAS